MKSKKFKSCADCKFGKIIIGRCVECRLTNMIVFIISNEVCGSYKKKESKNEKQN